MLDGSRIHNEAYEWARKMAVDALEYDEEDNEGEGNPASAIEDILRCVRVSPLTGAGRVRYCTVWYLGACLFFAPWVCCTYANRTIHFVYLVLVYSLPVTAVSSILHFFHYPPR